MPDAIVQPISRQCWEMTVGKYTVSSQKANALTSILILLPMSIRTSPMIQLKKLFLEHKIGLIEFNN
jgi:hypothetical protein